MSELSSLAKEVFLVDMISTWSSSPRKTVSIEKDLYIEFFSFLKPVHTIHDRATGNPIFFLFNRLELIEAVKKKYNFQEQGKKNGT